MGRFKTWGRRAALALAAALIIPGCAGTTAYCKRNADGTVECGLHLDGKHDAPIPQTGAGTGAGTGVPR